MADIDTKDQCATYAYDTNDKAIGAYWDESDNGCWIIFHDEVAKLKFAPENPKPQSRWGCMFDFRIVRQAEKITNTTILPKQFKNIL